MTNLYDFTMKSIDGDEVSLSQYRDTVCLLVNVASYWGLTGQYAGLRALHDELHDQGFTVLGFPCNQFGAQEPGTDAEILEFATANYGVTFPLFSKIEVNGDGACELYQWLREQTGGADIPWNFSKFLIDRNGNVSQRFDPMVTPEDIAPHVAELL